MKRETDLDSNVPAYNPISGRHYTSWEELVAAESTGLVIVITSSRPNTNPAVYGPFTDKVEALKIRVSVRNKYARDERMRYGSDIKVTSRLVLAWKDPR
jgi:hypothetical protein